MWLCWRLALSIHIHLEAFSAVSVINLIDVILFLPTNPNLVKTLKSDWIINPVQPISIGSQWTCLSFILHCSKSSWYLVSFLSWDSTMFSSHDTVNSHMINCFIVFKTRIISGQSCVQTRWSGNFSYSSKLTNNSQSGAVLSRHDFSDGADRIFPTALRKLILLLTGLSVLVRRHLLNTFAITWLWCQI